MGNPILKDSHLNGLILVGGKSSRMGTNKAFLDYHGKPQIEFLTELLSNFCSEVFISAKQKDLYPEFHVIEDKYDFESPLNGILSAFEHDNGKALLVVACDMPFINEESIKKLVAERDKNKVATCFVNEKRSLEPLFTIYEQHGYSALMEHSESGNHSPRAFLQQNDVHEITPENFSMLQNINTYEQFKLTETKLNK